MKRLSPKARIAIGLAGLTASLVLTASFFDLIPDRNAAVREGRAAMAEAIAANSSVFVTQADIRRLGANLRFVVERNDDLLSAAVRRSGGEIMVDIDDHRQKWGESAGDQSTDARVQVPIWAGQRKWGQVELLFRPLSEPGWRGFLKNPMVQLVGFIVLAGFIAFYFYLGKMLKQLDPSKAVPARVRSALDTMAEGLLVLDAKGQIALANQAFASIVGKVPDKLMGINIVDFRWSGTDGEPIPVSELPWTLALDSGVPQKNAIVRLQLGQNSRHTFMTNCSPVLAGDGRSGGVLVSFDDVTQLEEKEDQLRRAKDDAEAANQAKSAFLANMSHEIRTPMNAILGFTEVLKRGYGRNPEDSRHFLETIHSSGQHLLGLINDILDLSKVEAGRLELERTGCAPHQIVQEVIQILGVKAGEKGISLEFRPQGMLPETLHSDPTRIRQIVTNLVGNALKFTERGGVEVIMRLADEDQDKQLVIEITDTGIGMPGDKLEAIFDPFVQADESTTRRFGGTGLGLAISRKFARALGGDIVAHSAPGEGSTFVVTLAAGDLSGVRLLAPAELLTAGRGTAAVSDARWVFPRCRVLVVDDGQENRELVSLVLGDAGLEVLEAENGQAALDQVAQSEDLDVILMDMQMPVMDGLTATRVLREQGIETPVIALTANAMKGFEEELRGKGFSGYMTKPIDIDRLIGMLAELLGGRREETAASASAPAVTDHLLPSGTAVTGEPVAAGPPILSRLPTGNPKFARLVERFIPRLHQQMDAIDSAWEARDFNGLATLAHWLKGAGGTVGFDDFTEPAAELEKLAKTGSETGVSECLVTLHDLASRLAPPAGAAAESAGTAETPRPDPATLTITTPYSKGQDVVVTEPPGAVTSRLAGDPRLAPVIGRFAIRLQEQMTAIETAWSRRDLAEITSLAHWLKGAAGTVGFDVFTESAQNLHDLAKQGDEGALEPLIQHLRQLCDAVVVPEIGQPRERRAG